MANETARTWSLPLGDEGKLTIDADAVAIELRPVEAGEQPRLEVRGRDADRLGVSVTPHGPDVEVSIDIERGHHFGFGHGDLRVVAFVPRDVTARVHVDAGSVEARDLGPCDLELTSDAGRIRLQDVHGRLRLRTDAGQISGRRIGGSVQAESDAGQIKLAIDRLDVGEHRIRTDVGAVSVDLAPGLEVRVDTRAALGSARSSYPSRPDAAASLRVSTDLGSVRVREGLDGGGEEEHDDRSEAHSGFGIGRGWPTPPMPPMPPVPPMPPEAPWEEAAGGRPGGAGGSRSRPADAEVERILKMVESGELSARDADELLRALNHE